MLIIFTYIVFKIDELFISQLVPNLRSNPIVIVTPL